MPRPPRSPSVSQKKRSASANELTRLLLVEKGYSPQQQYPQDYAGVGPHEFNGSAVAVALIRPSHSRHSSLSSLESGYYSSAFSEEANDEEEYDGADYFNDIHRLHDRDNLEQYREEEEDGEDHYLEPTKLPRQSPYRGKKWHKRSPFCGPWWIFKGWMALPSSLPRADPAALQFAFRMALLLTVSALFILIQTPEKAWPDAMWVLVSVLFVSWFPSLDAASVVEKIFQRLIGTFVGAVLGLGCGFLSLWLFRNSSRPYQATFLGCCMLVFNFLIVFLAGQCKVGGVKVIRKYAYATILCVLTFCICMLPFGGLGSNRAKWMKGVMRVVNVTIGCLLGAVGAIVVSPKSTAAVLHDKTARQVKLCGEASEAVLAMAADHFAGKVIVQGLADELVSTPLETTVRWSLRRVNSGNLSEPSLTVCKNADVALQKYEDAMEDWKASKMLFPLTRFDPFHLRFDETSYEAKTALNKAIARTLARTMRIQTTVVMIDGMVRHDTEYNLSRDDLRLLRVVGSLVQAVLAVPLDVAASNEAAQLLLDELEKIRARISLFSRAMAAAQHDDFKRSRMERQFRESLASWDSTPDVNDELVEHLILRTLSLYQAWKQVQVHATRAAVTDGTLQSWLKSESDESQLKAVPKPGDSLRSLIGM